MTEADREATFTFTVHQDPDLASSPTWGALWPEMAQDWAEYEAREHGAVPLDELTRLEIVAYSATPTNIDGAAIQRAILYAGDGIGWLRVREGVPVSRVWREDSRFARVEVIAHGTRVRPVKGVPA